MLDQNTSIPLYEQMKISIRRDIERKKYAPGDRMPSEPELEEQYRVSRITVRRAIKELCDENVLIKRQGKGTFVIGEENKAARLDQETLGFHESIRRNGKSARSEVIKKEIIKVLLQLLQIVDRAYIPGSLKLFRLFPRIYIIVRNTLNFFHPFYTFLMQLISKFNSRL